MQAILCKLTDIVLQSRHHNKPFGLDATFVADDTNKPVVIFIHGFKGFKDWGPFNLMANHFAQAGFVFIKLNLSHNGTSIEHPTEFADLEAFGNNNFSTELDDVGVLLDYLFSDECLIAPEEMHLRKIYLIGHSRGGGIAILKAAEDPRITQVATWAAISSVQRKWGDATLEKWKQDGVQYIHNARTKQEMPLYYQLYEDTVLNQQRLDILAAVQRLSIPLLIIHGTADESVSVQAAHDLKKSNEKAELILIENALHTFGGYHPYEENDLPPHTQVIVENTIKFFNQ